MFCGLKFVHSSEIVLKKWAQQNYLFKFSFNFKSLHITNDIERNLFLYKGVGPKVSIIPK